MKPRNRACGTAAPAAARHSCRALLLLLALSLGVGLPARAHTGSQGAPPSAPHTLRLKHRTAAELIALFGREQYPGNSHVPRSARPDARDSLVPYGIDGILRIGGAHELRVVGREGTEELLELIRELDVPVETVSPGRQRVTVTLRRASGTRLKSVLARQAGGGSVVLQGRGLKLEGSAEWLHRALRQVIRAELGLSGPPAP
ncbi:MAG: hypothetical protein ACK47B_01490 [Armatimonadota bacterium]